MVQVNYDLRPVDTEVVVYTRNRIRLSSTMIIFGVLLYLNISPMFTQAQASWVHLLHVVFQPFILFASVADSSMIAYGAFLLIVSAFGSDIGVFVLNYIAVQRCLDEPSASCSDRLTETGVWVALAGWFCLFDLLIIAQVFQLKSQMERKDKTEKKNLESQKAGEDTPTWNSIEVYTNKIRVVALFLILFDVVQVSITSSFYGENPMFVLCAMHMIVDPFTLIAVRNTKDPVSLNIVRVIYFASFLINAFLLTILLQMEITDIIEMLSLLITLTYVVTDMVQILFLSTVITTIANYKKYKNKK